MFVSSKHQKNEMGKIFRGRGGDYFFFKQCMFYGSCSSNALSYLTVFMLIGS